MSSQTSPRDRAMRIAVARSSGARSGARSSAATTSLAMPSSAPRAWTRSSKRPSRTRSRARSQATSGSTALSHVRTWLSSPAVAKRSPLGMNATASWAWPVLTKSDLPEPSQTETPLVPTPTRREPSGDQASPAQPESADSSSCSRTPTRVHDQISVAELEAKRAPVGSIASALTSPAWCLSRSCSPCQLDPPDQARPDQHQPRRRCERGEGDGARDQSAPLARGL